MRTYLAAAILTLVFGGGFAVLFIWYYTNGNFGTRELLGGLAFSLFWLAFSGLAFYRYFETVCTARRSITEEEEREENYGRNQELCIEDIRAVGRGEMEWHDAVRRACDRMDANPGQAYEWLRKMEHHLDIEALGGAMLREGRRPEEVAERIGEELNQGRKDEQDLAFQQFLARATRCNTYAEYYAHRALWVEMERIAEEFGEALSGGDSPRERLQTLISHGIPEVLAKRVVLASKVMKGDMKEFKALAVHARQQQPDGDTWSNFNWAYADTSKEDAIRLTSLAYHWEPDSAEAVGQRSRWGESYKGLVNDLLACGQGADEARRLARRAYWFPSRIVMGIGGIMTAAGLAGVVALMLLHVWWGSDVLLVAVGLCFLSVITGALVLALGLVVEAASKARRWAFRRRSR